MSDEEKNVAADDEAKADAEAKARAKAEALAAAKARKEAEEAAKPAWERDPKPPAPVDAADDPLVAGLHADHADAIRSATLTGEDLTIHVDRATVRGVCEDLKSKHGFHLLVDICGADYPQREDERFEVVYHVFNLDENRRLRLRLRVAEGEEVPSVISAWRGAEWCEREIYDMYGVVFSDHPDMSRILTWDGFNGHPLRKDFPVEGVDTGAAIYPERYDSEAGPIAGTGTGWKIPQPEPAEEAADPTGEVEKS